MKFGLDTLHEKGWFKSAAAITAFLVSMLALVSALKPYLSAPPQPVAPAVQLAPAVAGQRTLDDASKNRLLQQLGSRDLSVVIVCLRQNDEAAQYAREIKSFLEDQGFHNVGLAFTSFPSSAHGVVIEKDGHRAFIKVRYQ